MLGGDTTKGERGGSNGSSSSSSGGDVGIVISKQQQQQQTPRNNRNNTSNNNKSNRNKNKNNNNNKNSTILRSTNNNNNKKKKKGSRSSHNNHHHHSKNKIIIRPYNKPPTLPINYYEDTVNDILIGTTEVLKVSLQLRRRQQQQQQRRQQRRQQEQEQEQSSSGGVLGSSSSFSILNMTSTISSSSTSSNSDEGVGGTPTGSPGTPAAGTSGMSLQNSYNAVTNLVNHRHGSRLYKDLISSLRNATHIVLPSLITEKTMKKKKDNHNNNNDRMIDHDDDDKDDDHPNANANAEEQEEEEEDLPLLDEIPTLYRIYTDYLLLCQHVFLPLDRTHAYDAINDIVVSTRGNGGGSASGNSGSSGATIVTQQSSQHQHQQSIWHVGLSLWYERLKILHYDSKLYQQWLNAFFLDWNGNSNNNNYHHTPSHHNYNYSHNTMGGYYDKNQQDETIHMPTTPTGAYNNNNSNDSTSTTIIRQQQQKQQRQQLKDVWYMWQDLGLLSQLPLQHDLETYWTNISQQWTCCGDADGTTATNTTANDIQQQQNSSSLSLFPTKEFLQFCTDKHIRCTIWSQWLPVQWLRSILDVFLVKPHLLLLSTDATTTTTTTSAATMMMTVTTAASAGGMGSMGSSTGGGSTTKKFKPPVANLLRPENLHPILLEEVSNHSKLSSSSLMVEGSTTTTSSSTTTTTTSISSSLLLLSSTNNTYNNNTTSNTTNTISPIQQLWMLAGRIHGGHTAVATAIASFVRIQGLQRVVLHHNHSTSTSTGTGGGKQQQVTTAKSTTTTTASSSSSPTQMIQELLQFQDAVYGMIRSLPNPTQYGLYGTGGIVHGVPHPATEQQHQQQQHHQIQLKNVWEEIVNTDVTPSVAECLAKFFDLILRSNKKMDQYRHAFSQSSSSSWIQQRRSNPTAGGAGGGIIDTTNMIDISSPDQWLQSILTGLFVPLQSKDIFEAFYRRDLAKRLLWNRITSIDIEKSICSLLKAECGTGYTSKMEGMFQDIEYSRETMNVYKQINNNNNNQSSSSSSPVADTAAAATTTATATASSSSSENHVDMEVQVLTTGYWPVYPKYPNLILPDSLCIPRDQFATHYKTKYQGRRMTWQYALGHCIVKCNGFKKKPYFELVVSLCQALVLLQFQTSTSRYTISQLMTMVGLDDRNEMERILQSLSLAKEGTRILRKIDHQDTTTTTTTNNNSNSKKSKVRMSVHDNDIFCIDDDFHSNKNRIRINNIMMKETKEERDKTVDAISRDRLYLIDAVLVRIMKARKTILHHILIPQVLEQMKIPAQTTDIKKRIESLIEREYMERDDKDRNRYNYLA